jgi:hypothetical protein
MKIKILKFLPIILAISISTFAQQTGTLRGLVTDSLSGEVLPYSNVLIEETSFGASTDLRGIFTITGIPANKEYSIRVTFVGYVTKFIRVTVKPNQVVQLNIPLAESTIRLQEIEKVGEKVLQTNETNLGLQKLSVRELEMLPKGVETDIFRSLQFLPGVQTTGDISARYYVRGGASDQNLVLLNNIPIYNPFHALGLFSIIDPEMINALEFYKGGFTAEYGGRLSSVLNMITKDGNKNRYSGNASVGFLTAKAGIEGPIPGGSFIITGRKSLFDNVLKKFLNYKDAPFSFYDLSAKLNYATLDTKSLTKFSVQGFNSHDGLINADPSKADYSWTNNLYGFYWFQAWQDVPIYSEVNFSVSTFDGSISPKLSSAKEKENSIRDITLAADFTNVYDSRDEIRVGYELKSLKTAYNFENLQGTKSALAQQALHFSLYAKYKFLRFEKIGADIGTRINLLSLTKQHAPVFEPRINLTYAVFPWIILKGAWGIYSQELITLTNENEIISLFEPWSIVPKYLPVPEAVHYVAGLEFRLPDGITFNTEVYYKDLKRTVELNPYKVEDSDPDLVLASGEAYGAEFMFKYSHPYFQFTTSYSLSWSYRNINDWISYPRYDSRNAISSNVIINFGDGWEASLSWFFHSGLPFTQIVGYYDKLYLNDLYGYGGFYGNYIPYTLLGDPNLGRLPSYHRLDAGLTKKIDISFTKIEISINVLNVYDRANIFYFERDTGKRVNMLPVLPTALIRVEI